MYLTKILGKTRNSEGGGGWGRGFGTALGPILF